MQSRNEESGRDINETEEVIATTLLEYKRESSGLPWNSWVFLVSCLSKRADALGIEVRGRQVCRDSDVRSADLARIEISFKESVGLEAYPAPVIFWDCFGA